MRSPANTLSCKYSMIEHEETEETERSRGRNIFLNELLATSGSFAEPLHVRVVGRDNAKLERLAGLHRWSGPRIAPLADFGMAVGKVQAACAVVIAGGPIIDSQLIRGITHRDAEPTFVNAVLAFIDQHPICRRTGIRHIRNFTHDLVLRAWGLMLGENGGCVEPAVHRY